MSYKHLSLEERHYIQLSMKKGLTLSEIAQALERSTSTILREVRRNTGRRGYRYQQANRMAEERHKMKPKAIKLTQEITSLIDAYICLEWSPEQIAGRLKADDVISLHLHADLFEVR